MPQHRVRPASPSRKIASRAAAVSLLAALVPPTQPAAPAQSPDAGPTVGQPGKDVYWIPTAPALAERMLDLAGVAADDFVIDLGSGDGLLVVAAARRGARALGIEYDRRLYELSRQRAAQAGVAARTEFLHGDLFEADLSRATVITMYLTESANLRLRPGLLRLKPGTRIVSNTFTMGDWRPDESAAVYSLRGLLVPLAAAVRSVLPGVAIEGVRDHCYFHCEAHLWIVPARVEGNWLTGDGELRLRQAYQAVSGSMVVDGREWPIGNGRLRGDRISFEAGGAVYSGRVTAGRIDGHVTRNGRRTSWTAIPAQR